VGFGRIARETARKARALGMKIYYTNRVGDKNYSDYKWLELDELLKKADFISIHVPYDENTCPIISDREFSLMKEGAFLVNTARGGVVDEKSLLKALDEGKIAGAGIDVFENEPEPDPELVGHPLVIATPHIGASTKEARARIGVEVLNIIKNMEEQHGKSL
jgi:D-3-phosphoglycerate dehydrogenase